MLTSSIFALAVAGIVNAATPAGFEPASTEALFVAFGDKAAVDGVLIPRAQTAKVPIIGTKERLVGTYAIIMTDPDIPGAPKDGKTGQFLHWLQTDLTSAATATTVAGQQIFVLSSNGSAAAAIYAQPSPPNRAPVSHRYVELLINTTGNTVATTMLNAAGKTRTGFSALNVVTQAAVKVIAGNSFNVTNEQALGGAAAGGGAGRAESSGVTPPTAERAAQTSGRPLATGTTNRPANSTSSQRPVSTGAATSLVQNEGVAMFAGLVALVASFAML